MMGPVKINLHSLLLAMDLQINPSFNFQFLEKETIEFKIEKALDGNMAVEQFKKNQE